MKQVNFLESFNTKTGHRFIALAQHEQQPPSVQIRAAGSVVVTCPAVAVGSGCPSLGLVAHDTETMTDNVDGWSHEKLSSLEPLC